MTQTIEELRAEIARLSGALPDSKNPKHLAERLADLQSTAFASISMTKAALAALDRVVDADLPGKRNGRPRRAELVRKALAEYARARGYESEAALLEETDKGASS